MSLLYDPYVSPSRVRGVFRYMLQTTGQRENREKLERYLSPESLIRGGEIEGANRSMIKATINECIKMSLLVIDKDDVVINPELPEESLSKAKGDKLLSQTITSLIVASHNDANHNLASVLAWYLSQDAYSAPGNWETFLQALLQQIGAGKLAMNNARYTQFEDWACFLGFAWRHSHKNNVTLTPDPTQYLRHAVRRILGDLKEPIALGQFINNLCEYCPVFETGSFRVDIENKVKRRETEQHLSSTTSLALLRLENEKVVRLSTRGDAPVYTFPHSQQETSFTHIKLF